MPIRTAAIAALALAMTATAATATPDEDRRAVAALDTAYQAAVERNDAEAMAAVHHENMILVLGDGRVYSGKDLERLARDREFVYERQVEDEGTRTVRLYGPDTAIITARLWSKGVRAGQPFEHRLWFSDTYVRTPQGWRYVFGQASLVLPDSDATMP